MNSELDIGPLSWVKDEIELALARTAELLQKYAGKQDAAVLGEARTSLHQAHGALAVVGLDGITEFSRAIERLLNALAEGEAQWSPALGEAAQEGIADLRHYLDELIAGRPDQPLRLLPAYRRLNEARGAQETAASDLFFPDLTQRPPKRESSATALDEPAKQVRLKAARLGFERGLSKWFKQDADNPDAGIRDMRNSIAMIEALQDQPATRAFWWVALAYFDALAAGGFTDDDATRRLCGRIDAQVRKLLDGAQAVAERLMRDVLYGVATSSFSNAHIELVRAAYRLSDLVPAAVAADDPRETTLREMRELLGTASNSWDQFCSGAAIALPRFHEQSTQLATLAQQLGQVDLSRLAAALANTANLLRKNPLLHTDALAGELATALLLAEHAVNHFHALDADFAPQVDALTGRLNALQRDEILPAHELPALQVLAQRAAGKIALHRLAKDLRADLQQAERALDVFFRDSANHEALAGVAGLLQKIAAMFEQLGQPRAVEVTQECAQRIAAFATPVHASQPDEFEDVARKISALGLFVDQLQRGSADLDALLAPVFPVAASAPSVEAELSQMARMARTLVGALREAPADTGARESLRSELKQNLESVRDNARLVADAGIERQADVALAALDSETSSESIEAAIAPLAPLTREAGALSVTDESVRLAQASADEVDNELLGIFVEEVLQVLDTVGVQLYRSKAAPGNPEHLTILRRGFHTLKGSSRMVGLRDFSEAARVVETTLGRFLQNGKPATPALHAMLDTAQHIVSDWVERLQRHASAPDATPLLRQCEALKQGQEEEKSQAAAPALTATAEDNINIGSLNMPRGLYETYLGEVRSHLVTLEQNWQRAPTTQMIRAAHTLGSTSATLGVVPIQVLAQALEHALERFAQTGTATDAAQDTALQLTLRRLSTMVTAIAEQRFPPADDELAARLDTLNPVAANKTNVDSAKVAMHDLLPLFLEECQDLVPAAATGFRDWRSESNQLGTSAGKSGGAESLQRILHTLKGSARMAGVADIGEAIHGIETGVAEAQAKRTATPQLIDELETAFDRIVTRIDGLRTSPEIDAEAARPMLRVRADLVDTMVNEAGEIAIARSRIDGSVKALRSSLGDLTENVARLRAHLRELEIQAESRIQSNAQSQTADQKFDPLEMDRFTRLQELTRILAESVNDVDTVEHILMRDLDQVDAALSQQARMSRELTQHLMGVRMVPFASIVERLQRVVRLTSNEAGKKVAFSVTGGETELDRSVLEHVTGPIEHMVRNAIVHGIENADKRAAAGKRAQGEVRLTLVHAGNEAVISVGDDGAGLDYPRIRNEAIKKGLLAAEQPVSEAQLTQLIYQPGFTTAATLSEVAGRGVGMDVVRNETLALGGRIEAQAEPGRGTRFSLYLPLTLAVIPVLLVKAGARNYAIPSSMVVQASEMKPEAMVQLRSAVAMEWQGQRFDLHYLPRLLGDVATQPTPQRRHWVILLRAGVQRIALELDALVGNEEVVIKNIGPQLARVPGISGATVLGDGEVVLIINPVALIERQAAANAHLSKTQQRISAQAIEQAKTALPPMVMVVDDSLTVRKITGRLLDRAGYRVVTAKDGVDALEQLAEVMPAVILADIEMPRMDGFELVRRLRADTRFKALPIIMITSRIADKHRNYAMELGANHYLGKPYDEEALLAMIAEHAGK